MPMIPRGTFLSPQFSLGGRSSKYLVGWREDRKLGPLRAPTPDSSLVHFSFFLPFPTAEEKLIRRGERWHMKGNE
ncbi:hypothetical protein M6B38_205635 [Iris pallida]|uniref:Uncharacterized protein n=1 Tax=Iris pallida TaxID=29817 RepID=A0AAX6E807_IRIPA|nr:hypothetical protein M6B38_205635 [Iris pallida]